MIENQNPTEETAQQMAEQTTVETTAATAETTAQEVESSEAEAVTTAEEAQSSAAEAETTAEEAQSSEAEAETTEPTSESEEDAPQAENSTTTFAAYATKAEVVNRLKEIADNDEEFLDIARSLDANPAIDSRWLGDAVKTAPKGWPKDHPMIQYLRPKDIGRIAPLDRRAIEDGTWPGLAAARMADMMPLVNFINYSIDEEV